MLPKVRPDVIGFVWVGGRTSAGGGRGGTGEVMLTREGRRGDQVMVPPWGRGGVPMRGVGRRACQRGGMQAGERLR